MTVRPGDVVHHEGADRVVVDVTGDGWAVMRAPGDLTGEHLDAARVDTLTAVGHVESVPGWVEDEPGVWRRGGDQ